MSDPRAKAERSKAKDDRQMPVPDKVAKRKPSKKDKPITVLTKHRRPNMFSWGKNWCVFGRYKTREIAEKVIKDDKRKHPDYYDYKIG